VEHRSRTPIGWRVGDSELPLCPLLSGYTERPTRYGPTPRATNSVKPPKYAGRGKVVNRETDGRCEAARRNRERIARGELDAVELERDASDDARPQ